MSPFLIQVLLLLTAVAITGANYNDAVQLIWEFPSGTWIENLAVRHNGNILATSATTPEVFEIDPSRRQPARVRATIPDHLALAGIVEVEPDVFFTNANNFSVKTLTAQPNSSAIHRLDFSRGQRTVRPELVSTFEDSILLNGLARCGKSQNLLVGDSGLGQIWLLNSKTGKKRVVVSNNLTKITNTTGEPIGVNGLAWSKDTLYWSNTNQQILAKVRIDANCNPIGEAQVLTHYDSPDDILLFPSSESKDVLLCGNDQIRLFEKGNVKVVSNDTLFRGSTAIRRDRASKRDGSFFVSTSGGVRQYLEGNPTNPGKIVRLQF